MAKRRCCLLVAIALTHSTGVGAQSRAVGPVTIGPVTIGSLGSPSGFYSVPSPMTVIDRAFPTTRDGSLTSATFQWSAFPCRAAVKIKTFYEIGFIYTYGVYLDGERGPFDVVQSTQTVALAPPLPVRKGEYIAVTSLTECGGPVRIPGGSFVLRGDAGSSDTGNSFTCSVRTSLCSFDNGSPAIQAVGGLRARGPLVIPFRK